MIIVKKKIGDSQVIAESMPYVNLNVLHGVRELNKGKSFGVMVQIEDQFGTIVKAGDFFKGPSCTVGMREFALTTLIINYLIVLNVHGVFLIFNSLEN